MSKLQLVLLGRFECLLSSGTRITLSMRKAEVLLAYLALAPGLRHPRERLINLLWSDRGEEQARNSLRQCLSAIKKSLGEAADLALQVDRTTVCLSPDLIEVDVHEFERLAAEGDYESLTTAADLYQGEFLEGISIRDPASQEWLDNERSRFKRQFIEILSNLAQTQLISHDFGHAIRSAERLVKQDPLGESGWRLLMRSYHESGDRNHALQAFKRCQQSLRDELDVEPETATRELREQIAGGETSPPRQPVSIVKESTVPAPPSTDHSIAVLPFDNLSGDPEQEYFSDGITDSIIMNLSLFPGLNVKSRNSSFAFKQQIKGIGEISDELGVDYIVEGSIRKSVQRIRITVQLIEAASANQVWGKRYDAEIENLFDLEEELSRTIAATVTGQIESDLQRIALAKGAADQQAYDFLLSGNYHMRKFTGPDTVVAIDELNRCLELDPKNVLAHSWLYYCHAMNWGERWVEDYKPSLELARKHARQAIELGPEVSAALIAYAEQLIFKRENDKAMTYIDKALAINPNDPDALAMKSLNLTTQARYEEALQAAELGCQLDPFHHWCDWCLAEAQFFCGQYEKALETIAISNNAPGFIRIYTIAANLKLDRPEQARKELQEFLSAARNEMLAMPQSRDEWLAYTVDNAPYEDSRINEKLVGYLYEAGLEQELKSVLAPADDMPSIAVLPFENMSGDPEQEHFADGITADIISTLSKFPHLRTISRYSTLQYRTDKPSIARISKEQSARYLLEGSVRKSGNRIRVSTQLIDATDEKICWSERYDRDLDDLFSVQDELTRQIALAMKVHLDDGEKAVHRSKGATSIKAWELVMTAADLQDTHIRQHILDGRAMAEQAIALDPNYPYAWVTLGWSYWQEAYNGWSDQIEQPIEQADKANRQAMSLDPYYGETWSLAGMIHQMKHESAESIEACRKAVELEPGSAEVHALTAWAYIVKGEYEQARQYDHNMRMLCPIRPAWYYLVSGGIEQRSGNLEKAIEIYQRSVEVEPESPLSRFYLIDAMMEIGDEAGARILADEIRALDNSVNGRGLVHTFSYDESQRQRFHDNLAKFDLV